MLIEMKYTMKRQVDSSHTAPIIDYWHAICRWQSTQIRDPTRQHHPTRMGGYMIIDSCKTDPGTSGGKTGDW